MSTPLFGTVALWVAAMLTLWSMFHYLRLAAPHFGGDAGRSNPTPRHAHAATRPATRRRARNRV